MRDDLDFENLIEGMLGEKCAECGAEIKSQDIEEIIRSHEEEEYPFSDYINSDESFEPICADCYFGFFGTKEFREDYNPLHPEETADEFEDHEDWEPRD